MQKPNEYLGDSDGKRVVRTQMYRRARQLFQITGKPAGSAVTLAGPEANDFSALRYVLDYKAKDICFVDLEVDGLIHAVFRDDNVQIIEGDIVEALLTMKECSLVNLDFCGKVNEKTLEACRVAASKLNMRGLLFYTFFRGRENAEEQAAMLMPPNDSRSQSAAQGRELARVSYVAEKIIENIGNVFELVFAQLYDSKDPKNPARHSPMGVLGFQKMPLNYRSASWTSALTSSIEGAVSSKLIEKNTVTALRAQAIALAHQGMKSREIQEILNIHAARIAAWIAVDTMRKGKAHE